MTGIFYPIGTKVRLASGGTEMVVVDVDPAEAKATCAWRNLDGSAGEHEFFTICLDIVRRWHVVGGAGTRRGEWKSG